MFKSPEQFAAATKTLFELQMNTFNTLATKAMKGVEQVVSLNLDAARSSMESGIAAGKDIGRATDPHAALKVAAAHVQPGMDHAMAYGQDLKSAIDEIHREFTSAAEAHMAEAKNALSALIYDVTENVKPGQADAVQIVKAAIDNAFRGYEEVTKATRQAVRQVEDQVAKASEQVVKKKAK
jgi:phasin family protein